MALLNKRFVLGLGVGICLTLVALDLWATYLQRTAHRVANPLLLASLQPYRPSAVSLPKSSERLPKPWLPEPWGQLHDDWSVRPLRGEPLKLSEFKGKVVFLNFWSTHRLPCIQELPGIERLYDSFKDDDRVAFLMVATDDEQRVRDFLSKNPLHVPMYLAERSSPKGLPVMGVPTTFILDRKGAAVFREWGAANWDNDGARGYIRSLASGPG